MDLYNDVLRDPTPTDWASDPLESLSVLSMPHHQSYEHWFEVAVDRKDHERVLEISDLARRHRFLSTLEFGGRLHNLRWLLEGSEEILDQEAKLQRQDLLARYAEYEQLHQQALEKLRNGTEARAAGGGRSARYGRASPTNSRSLIRNQHRARIAPSSDGRAARAVQLDLSALPAHEGHQGRPARGACAPELLLHAAAGLCALDDAATSTATGRCRAAINLMKPMMKLLQGVGNVEANRAAYAQGIELA